VKLIAVVEILGAFDLNDRIRRGGPSSETAVANRQPGNPESCFDPVSLAVEAPLCLSARAGGLRRGAMEHLGLVEIDQSDRDRARSRRSARARPSEEREAGRRQNRERRWSGSHR
jgi:hypothetical protein